MTYQEQLLIVNSIPIKEGERKILTCPACGGFKKFSQEKKMVLYCGTASEPLAMLKVYLEADFQ